jgi:PAS domain S-box-containing protein
MGLVAWCLTAVAADAGPRRIRVGVEARREGNLSFVDQQGKPRGFAPELLGEMAGLGGIEFELVADSWTSLLARFNAGTLDVLANVSVSAERRATMDFSITHATMHGVAYSRAAGPVFRRTADLAGKKIAVLAGALEQTNAVAHGGWGGTVVPFKSIDAMFEAVLSGECDVVLSTRRLSPQSVRSSGLKNAFLDDVVHEYRMAVHKGDSVTLAQLNDALATLRQNGVFDRLYAKWIGPIEPHPVRLVDLQPYFLPAALVLIAIIFIIGWQRRTLAQRSAQAAVLRETEERYRGLVESAFDGVVIHQDGMVRTANAAYAAMFGYEVSELIGRPILDFSPSEEREKIAANISGSEETPYEAVGLGKDGSRVQIEISGKTCTFEGRPARIAAVRDITARKAADEALRASERKYRLLFENLTAGFALHEVILDASGRPVDYRYLEINPAFSRLTGVPVSALLGKTVKTVLPNTEDYWIEVFGRVAVTGEPMAYENYSGELHRHFDTWAFCPAPGLFAVIFTDVTARKEAETALGRLNADLERRVEERTAELAARMDQVEQLNLEQRGLLQSLKASEQSADRAAARLQEVNAHLLTANQELEAFSYSVSHDLRAPLRNITGFIELLGRRAAGRLDSESERFIAVVTAEAKRMGMLIDDLLTFSRIGRAELDLQTVPLDALIVETRDELRGEIGDRVITWKIGVLPSVRGDRVLLRQVIANLLSNAVKFTRRRPEAVIEIGAGPTRPGDTAVTFFVRDNGAGFNPKYLDKLFGVFQRLHNPRDFEGTGIGLANVKRIVTRHGGRVWAEGKVDQGAVFYFSLPLPSA